MYLKILEKKKDELNGGMVDKWYIIPNVEEVDFEWVKKEPYEHPMYDGARIIETKRKLHLGEEFQYVRELMVRSNGIYNTIYCNDSVYLCNDDGKTIEYL